MCIEKDYLDELSYLYMKIRVLNRHLDKNIYSDIIYYLL